MVKPGSVIGGVILIMGSCIGAGMFALPILTGISGFMPSFGMFLIAWLFMTTTALLLIEVNSWFDGPVNLISMVKHTLGPVGKTICWFLYLFLLYSLLVAYMSAIGKHTAAFSLRVLSLSIPDWAGTLFFVILFGWIVYWGTRSVDLMNRWLMVGQIIAFISLVGLCMQHIQPKLLEYTSPKYSVLALPVLIVSFGFHNVIPSLTDYMKGDIKRVRQAIIIGSLFTLGIYMIWEVITLGVLPMGGSLGIMASYLNDTDASQALYNFLGSSYVGSFAQALAFFAILTSFLAQTLSMVHFLRDGFKFKSKHLKGVGVCVIALFPPFVFSTLYPQLFFQALSFAGGGCAVVLFGIMPVLMMWKGLYRRKMDKSHLVVGGKPVLLLILSFASFIFFYQLTTMFGFSLFPCP